MSTISNDPLLNITTRLPVPCVAHEKHYTSDGLETDESTIHVIAELRSITVPEL